MQRNKNIANSKEQIEKRKMKSEKLKKDRSQINRYWMFDVGIWGFSSFSLLLYELYNLFFNSFFGGSIVQMFYCSILRRSYILVAVPIYRNGIRK